MAISTSQIRRWAGGLADYLKEGIGDSYYKGQGIDYRSDPNEIKLQPAAIKESGTVVTDLLKWCDTIPSDLSIYSFGNTGNMYKRTSAGSWSKQFTAAQSHGNGLCYYYGDDYLYYANDKALGRFGPLSGSPTQSDDFLAAQGGVPGNTYSITLTAASSMYATAADSASLSVTGDLTLEAYFKATTLPAVGSSMTLLGKWNESGATRSYKLDLYGVSGYFGDGSDGALTISADATEAPIDSACTGTAAAYSLTATNASFAVNQVILINQTQGTGAGKWERRVIQGYTAGTITLGVALTNSYTTGAQVRVLKQYTNVTVNSGKTYTAKAWDGTVGGILGFLANGTVSGAGSISANGCGFRGGSQFQCTNNTDTSYVGESYLGVSYRKNGSDTSGYGNSGGGGARGATGYRDGAGGGGSNGGLGTAGGGDGTRGGGYGSTYGTADLTTLPLGGAGGGGVFDNTGGTGYGGNGGNGGGIIFITAVTTTSIAITSTGANGQNWSGTAQNTGGGAGAGGSILIKTQTSTLGTSLITAIGGTGGTSRSGVTGGNGGLGRIHLDYLTSYTGTTTPTLDATQDNNLVTTTTYQARLGISNDGTANEYLTANIPTLTTGVWKRLSVTWDASTSTALFYIDAVQFAQSIGTKTAIHDNASLLYLGANKGASTVGNFFNGLIDDVRIWANIQTVDQIYVNNQFQLVGSEGGLKAYWELNNAYTDLTANANTLTGVNTPVFTTDVPFPSPTTRLDIDQSSTTTGSTYTLPTAISETSTDMLTFTPTLDPQASMDFSVDTKGAGDWTLTIHDQQNRVVATKTVVNAQMSSSGLYEFIFSDAWRIIINKTYHAHLTVSSGTSKIVTSSLNNFQTAVFHTYYWFLVNDTNFHPMARMLNKVIIGNERYLATWDGASYQANFIALTPLSHVRCFSFWRDYLTIGVWQETTSGTGNIYDWSVGRIYFWDGISLTFNFWIDVPEGQVNAMAGMDTDLYFSAGWNGQISKYEGGLTTSTGGTNSTKVKKIPFLERESYMEIFPQTMTFWKSLLHLGIAANSSSSTLMKSVYSWGTLNPLYPESLSNDYPVSTGNTGSTVKIGMVYAAGQTLLIGWQDGYSYGCDQVTFTNNPISHGYVEGLLQDNGALWNNKQPQKIQAQFLPLLIGESVATKYSIDRGNWQNGTIDNTVGDIEVNQDIYNGRGREYQIGVDLYATGNTSPTVIGVAGLVNTLDEETQF